MLDDRLMLLARILAWLRFEGIKAEIFFCETFAGGSSWRRWRLFRQIRFQFEGDRDIFWSYRVIDNLLRLVEVIMFDIGDIDPLIELSH